MHFNIKHINDDLLIFPDWEDWKMPRVIVGNKDPIENSSSGKFESMK